MLNKDKGSRHDRNQSKAALAFVGGSNNVEYEMANLESQPSAFSATSSNPFESTLVKHTKT